jgi:UPF0271 protein
VNPTVRTTIDINADLGEGFPNDAALLELVTSTSVCCGAHAGSDASIDSTLKSARDHHVAVGAHPGYPDREGFGRRERNVGSEEVEAWILGQVRTLIERARAFGVSVLFVKPHGALYNQAQRDPSVASGVVSAARILGLPVLGQPGSTLERLARESGLRFVTEGFPDRRYDDDGFLVRRSRPDALLVDPATEIEPQLDRLHERGFDTLCIHGDAESALATARCVVAGLARRGITPRFWG